MNVLFQTPIALALVAAIPALVYLELRAKRRSALSYPSTAVLTEGSVNAGGVGPAGRRSWRQRLVHLPLILRALALALLSVALARPMVGRSPIRNVTEGIAIQMVIDRSGSMSAPMGYRGEPMTRFETAKAVFRDFVLGNGRELGGRPNDLVGVVAFAGFADTISPLTHSRDALEGILNELELVGRGGRDGTAIGDAIALGAARLKTAEEQGEMAGSRGDRFEIKSKVLILLTDGEQNAGERLPAQAAALAGEWGIKIYSIGVGSTGGGGGFSASGVAVLQQVAESTGGLFRLADDEQSLRGIYEEIDRLEKTEVESFEYLSVREYFVPFALAALGALALQILLSATALRRLP